MTGFSAFLTKELQEIVKTWRIWVLPGMVFFFALSSPVIAALTPKLISSMAESQPGVTIILPPPTWTDAYAQFLKNLSQVVLIAVVITGAGAISGERASGTAILTLTKPLARGAFVLAKVISQWLLLIAAAALGIVLCAVLTRAIFGTAPIWPLTHGVLLWLAYGLLLVTVMTFFSAAFGARGAAAGGGLAFFFLGFLIGIWAPALSYTWVGLLPAAARAALGQPATMLWPLLTAAGLSAATVAAAVKVFERQEL
jgi:ABC-2 type transport system permease protein